MLRTYSKLDLENLKPFISPFIGFNNHGQSPSANSQPGICNFSSALRILSIEHNINILYEEDSLKV